MKKIEWERVRAYIKKCIPPDPYGFSWLDILRVCFGLDILIMAVVLFNQFVGPADKSMEINAVFLVTALMILLMPASPMFHPKTIIEGNVVSALLASASIYIFPESNIAMVLSVSASAIAMYALKCFQPTALMLALFISTGKINSYYFALYPVFADSVVLVITAYLYGQITKHPYPAKLDMQ
jgi:CBS domain-containing membrane protein